MVGESDWEDEDLLTHEEAGDRLRDAIASVQGLAVGDDQSPAGLRARVRLAAMQRRLEHIDEALKAGFGTIRRIDKSV